jgi:hypothetical protein
MTSFRIDDVVNFDLNDTPKQGVVERISHDESELSLRGPGGQTFVRKAASCEIDITQTLAFHQNRRTEREIADLNYRLDHS